MMKCRLVSMWEARLIFLMRHGVMAGIFLTFVGFCWALAPDATREQVIAELGKPTSVARLGKREIMIYPGGVRLELEEGKVVAAEPVQPTKAKAAAEKAAKEDEDEPPMTEKERKQLAAENAAAEREDAQAHDKIAKAIEGLEASHDQGPSPALQKEFNFVEFLFEVVLKFLLTLAALKLACKYWGAEVFWNVILIVAGVDALVSGSMSLIGTLLLGFPTLFSAEDLVGGIVMLFLLKKLSVNHAIGQAVQLTLTTKVFSVVVGSFLITILLRLLH